MPKLFDMRRWMSAIIAAAAILLSFGSAMTSPLLVSRLEIEGASAMADEALLKGMSTHVSRPYEARVLRRDLDRILLSYRKAGYWHTAVEPVVKISDDRLHITLRMLEGVPTRLADVTIRGNSRMLTDDIRSCMVLRAGHVFRETVVEKDIQAVLHSYENVGYPFCSISPIVDLGPGTERPELVLQIDEGPLVRIDSVRFEGNRVTRADILRREMRFRSGMRYDSRRIRQGLNGLRRLPFLRSVEEGPLEPLPGSRRGDELSMILVVRLKEERTGRVEAGLGFTRRTEESGVLLSGRVGVRFENLSGRGRMTSFLWQRQSEVSSDMHLQAREPWLAGYPVRVGADVSMQQRPGYRESRLGMDVEWLAASQFQIGLGFRAGTVTPDSIGSSFQLTGLNLSERFWNFQVFAGWDTRDQGLNPRSGREIRALASWGRAKAVGNWQERFEYEVRADTYVPVGERWVAAFLLRGAGTKQAGGVGIEGLLRLGGAATLRGQYEEAFLAEHAGWVSLEWRHLTGGGSRTFVFLDAGALRERTSDGLRWTAPFGYGIGIRTASRLGQVGLDYGLSGGDTPGEGKVHVRMESAF